MPRLEIKILEFDRNGRLYTVQFEMLIDEGLANQIVSSAYNWTREEFYAALKKMTKPHGDSKKESPGHSPTQTPDIK